MKTSETGRVMGRGTQGTDFEKLPAGHYSGRGTRQDGTGPNGSFLEGGPARFLSQPSPRSAGGPKGYVRTDERIFENVCRRLADDGDLDASDIEDAVKDGVVTLTGFVDTRDQREWAEEIVDEVLGVDDVINRVRARRDG